MSATFAFGNVEIVKYLHNVQSEQISEVAMQLAAGRGHLDCLICAYELGYHPNNSHCAYHAANGGNLECLRYLLERGGQDTRLVCYAAAAKGHLEFIKVAREFGCP